MNRTLWGCCLLVLALPAAAGNRWMMEANAKEMIEMADAVASQVQGVKGSEQLRFEARVVERDGKRVIHLDRVELIPGAAAVPTTASPSASDVSPAPTAATNYQSAIRYAPIPQVQGAQFQPSGALGGGADLTEVQEFPKLLATHPEAKAYEFKGVGLPAAPNRSFWVSW